MGRRDLGIALYVTAEARGEPGQRTFRVCVLAPEGLSLSLWLEKEQLSALGEAIGAALGEAGYSYAPLALDDQEAPPPFPATPVLDLRAGQLALGVDTSRRVIVLTADESGEDDAVSVAIGFREAWELRARIAEVVAAGRQPCPLCSAPMDPRGHVCVRSNGHHPR